ncbi:uncharacterized protein LOC125226722 [Leguminivora glycinivorella]|uniref:uncharacterized protein LOC125226722 n=1 Tax=Leguminivora glycinivorella TaxID=1035111 RepID=UPI00200E186F|nr:uncharacterized protein LOC125226722 [Leguminivora glycinivorella]
MSRSKPKADFVKADSGNLPDIDMGIIIEYLRNSDKHNIAEIRGEKTLMASRSGYVQNAVGYVELKRDNTTCIVRAKVVPEHKITKKYYLVTVHINENENTIVDTECDGCNARTGGCKHTLVVLYWLEKKSTEPSPTSVQCYWNKPRLAIEGTEPLLTENIVKPLKRAGTLGPKNPDNFKKFLEECKKRKMGNSLILSVLPEYDPGLTKFAIFDMILDFTTKSDNHDFDNFKIHMSARLNKNVISEIEQATKKQAESKLWHSIRQGRITASKIHEACHCDTPDGSLVEQILGGYKMFETKAMKRGKLLEKSVVAKLESDLNCEIKECGFNLINLICGASPDGMTNNFIVEIKCPSSLEAVKSYVVNNNIKEKFKAQCQIQMLSTGVKKCAFCVADPEFEINKKVQILWLKFDAVYANKLLKKSEVFWKNNIYPKILKNAKA